MNAALYMRLSFMMFFQYAIWGVWGATYLSLHMEANLGFSGAQGAFIFGTMAIASILAPLIAGQIADRYFPTQYYLTVVHLLGAGVLYLMAQSEPDTSSYILGWSIGFWRFFGLMLVYQILYAPTVALTNSLSFHHLPQGEKQFGYVRVWGAMSWILVNIAFGLWLGRFAEGQQRQWVGECLNWASLFSLIMAGYCLLLPNTPPSKQAAHPLAFVEAFRLMKERSFLVLVLISFLVATELQFYYYHVGPFFTSLGISEADTGPITTIGQIIEVFILFALPWFAMRFGLRMTIAIGILAWPLRYAIFALGEPTWLVISVQGLHGVAYGFFFVGGQMYADRVAGKDVRASAQSLMVLATSGIGMLLSSLIAGTVKDLFEIEAATAGKPPIVNWHYVFLVPVAITVLGFVLFILTFREKTKEQLDAEFGRTA